MTNQQQYLHNHRLLRGVWLGPDQYLFAFLEPDQQWHLHEYFLPAKDWSDKKLLAHRRQLLKEQPLARVRGQEALIFLHEHVRAHAARLLKVQTNRRGPVLLLPDPDTYDLAHALHEHIFEMERKRDQRRNGTDSPPL